MIFFLMHTFRFCGFEEFVSKYLRPSLPSSRAIDNCNQNRNKRKGCKTEEFKMSYGRNFFNRIPLERLNSINLPWRLV